MRHPFRAQSLVITGLILVLGPVAASAQGTIEGAVTFWGDPGGGTQIEVAVHSDPTGPPDATVFVSIPGGAFSIPVPDGTYYVSTLMARDGLFGEPRHEDVLVWYDADADGDWDTVIVSGGAVTGVDVDLGFVYVDIDATGGANNGSSWTDAYTDLQDGIDLAVAGIEVWLAEGTYTPGVSRSDSFTPKNGVRVFGGFAGAETIRQQRDWNAHQTNLSGEIGAAAATDNCYHVVRAETSNPTAMLNGLTITRGYANGSFPDDQGGGVRARGGGVTLANVTLIDNYSSGGGGGAFANVTGTIKAYNCSFVNNTTVFEGGGYYASAAAAQPQTLVNCVFTGNTAFRGGGIALADAGLQPVLVNLSLSGNSAGSEGGGIYVNTSIQYTIHNSILWGNTGPNPQISAYAGVNWPIVNYSIIQGGYVGSGTHILTTDPSFADADLRLNLDSPAIDSGDSTAIPLDLADLDEDHWTDSEINVDLDMNWRSENIPYIPDTGIPDPYGFIVDMGAYEAWDPTLIFWDNFESGDTSEWDTTVGEP
jgi:hypothetical protein